MPDNGLKLTYSNHCIQFTEALGTLTCCQLNIFLHSRTKGLLQHGVVNGLTVVMKFFSNSYQKQIDKNHPYRPYINLKQF